MGAAAPRARGGGGSGARASAAARGRARVAVCGCGCPAHWAGLGAGQCWGGSSSRRGTGALVAGGIGCGGRMGCKRGKPWGHAKGAWPSAPARGSERQEWLMGGAFSCGGSERARPARGRAAPMGARAAGAARRNGVAGARRPAVAGRAAQARRQPWGARCRLHRRQF
ncbi:MAG: hypothetical protein J3K34DRAFT_247207 [Monoraphidium minutum]|nr:MAG: hypothetical protein J3K34DRAFT_247207 [Monoraphidium minutum]